MKSKLVFALALSCIVFGCEKSTNNDTLYLRGKLFLTDTITSNIRSASFPNAKVTITNNITDTLNYQYSVNTDNDGYFIFNLSKREFPYLIRYEGVFNTYFYKASKIVTDGENNFPITAILDQEKQNGFVTYLIDSTTNMGAIPGASVLVFTSEVLADVNDPSGAIQTLTSDATGKIFKLSLPPGRYFLNGKKQVGSTLLQGLKKIITVPAKGINGINPKDNMILK